MFGKRPTPQTPSPRSDRRSRITDYFKPIHHSELPKRSKRELEESDETHGQPAKKLKTRQDRHTAHSFRTVRLRVGVHTHRPKKTATSTRLLDATDAVLADRLVGRRFVEEKKQVVDKKVASPKDEHTESALSIRLRKIHNTRKPKKRPSSARLLNDVDGGLMDSLVGRFETTRYEEENEEDKAAKKDGNLEHDNSKNGTPSNNTNTSIGATSAGITEGNAKRDRYTTPSPRPLPSTPEHHGYQGSSPRDQPSAGDSPSSSLLPSPVVDLPLSSPPLSYNSSPVAWRSSPSSQ
ncbi:hypothetical protein B0H65DRAFT_593006 [Neurospora tetraspora]|uniref:Uncharacterized protein n=1 Tax=Neurospora tetraspora TaxID=94610 RepID=A0AAE0J1D9_9PEZI|nr:hypothetical protein B0H65DRAFT_593006 [Neurospora tetraspora]